QVGERLGWNIVAVFSDEGISGAKGRDARPGYDALLRAVTRREIDLVAAWSVDRLGRSLPDLDTSGNLLLRGAHGPIGFGFDIAVGLKGLFPLRPWPFEGGFAPVPPSW